MLFGRRVVAVLVAAMFALSVCACSGGGGSSVAPVPKITKQGSDCNDELLSAAKRTTSSQPGMRSPLDCDGWCDAGNNDECSIPISGGSGGPGGSGGGGGPHPTRLSTKQCTVAAGATSEQQAMAQKQAAGNAYAALDRNSPVLASPPDGQQSSEYYGYIYTNGPNYAYDGPYTTTLDANSTASPTPNSYQGWVAVGIWHTHPGFVGSGSPDGTQNGSHFSAADINYSKTTGLTMYVGEYNTEPSDGFRWYSRAPSATSDSAATLFGQGGC